MPSESGRQLGQVSLVTVPVYERRRVRHPPLRLSPNSVVIWRLCRQWYKFLRIDKLGDEYGTAKPHYTMANHVHTTLKQFMSIVPVRLRTADTVKKLLRKNWQRYRTGFGRREAEKRWLEKAMRQVTEFVLNHDVTVTPLMVEASVEAKISPGVVLRGRVDRVDQQPDDSLHIIDYKTGTVPDQVDWTQLLLHGLLVWRKFRRPVTKVSYLHLELYSLNTNETFSDDFGQTRWNLLVTSRHIRREKSYRPRPGPWCRRCDFISICSRKAEAEPLATATPQLGL